jgi:plasmid stability protein
MENAMASMTIRNIDEALKARLRVQAAKHGRSMEDEARDILRTALSSGSARASSLVKSIRARIEPLGGVDLEIAPREQMRNPLTFEE